MTQAMQPYLGLAFGFSYRLVWSHPVGKRDESPDLTKRTGV